MGKILASDGSFDPLAWVVARSYAILTPDKALARDMKNAVRRAENVTGFPPLRY